MILRRNYPIKFTHFSFDIFHHIVRHQITSNILKIEGNFLFDRKFLSSLFGERHVTKAILIFPINELNLCHVSTLVSSIFNYHLFPSMLRLHQECIIIPLRTFLSSLSFSLPLSFFFFFFFKGKIKRSMYLIDLLLCIDRREPRWRNAIKRECLVILN